MATRGRPDTGPRLRAAAGWALDRLPGDRRPAARALARSARSLALGTPLPTATAVAPRPAPAPAAPRVPTSRPWIRVRPKVEADRLAMQRLDDPGEAAAVRAGWQLVAAYEALTRAGAEKVFAPELAAWHDYARTSLPAAARREGIAYSPANWLRFRRMADFVRDGDAVFDVGTGKGELAGILLETRDITYRGVELEAAVLERFVAWQREAHPDRPLEVTGGNLYDLTPEQVAAGGTSIVMCCEVLEHVPDAEHGLDTLARTLPDGADLVFSVPLHGRLDSAWGHISVFDTHRIHAMVERAGLVVHHVEPLANTWTLVVANRDTARSERVARAERRPDVLAGGPLSVHRPFLPVDRERLALTAASTSAGATLTDEGRSDGVRVTGTAPVSVEVPAEGVEAVRLRLRACDEPSAQALRSVRVDVSSPSTRLTRWTWVPGRVGLAGGRVRLLALRPGEHTREITPTEVKDLRTATRVVVTFEGDPGVTLDLLLDVALLP